MKAFKSLYDCNIVHRHISLDNILVSFPHYTGDPYNEYSLKSFRKQVDLQKVPFRLLIADFDSACLRSENSITSEIGRDATMAPEMLQ
jgi:serine/threonine protein kinase